MKRILILTAGFGEGHNAAARGVSDGLARIAPDQAQIELRDLLAETYPILFKVIGKAYLAMVDHLPHTWRWFYDYLEQKENFHDQLGQFTRFKQQLAALLDRFQPDVVVSTFPAYPYLLDQIQAAPRPWKSVAVITDSITVSKIWYRSGADHFLLPNEQSAEVLLAAGIAPERIKVFGFPVNPRFADFQDDRPPPFAEAGRRVLYMINAGTRRAPRLVDKLLDLEIQLTVTVSRNEKLQQAIEAVARHRPIEIIGWTDEIPRILHNSHLLIGKAGGATVQEAIAARCPMIINHVVSGQEEGNARLIEQTNCGVIARTNDEVIAQIQRAFANGAQQWRQRAANIAALSRPRASLDIAEFLMSI